MSFVFCKYNNVLVDARMLIRRNSDGGHNEWSDCRPYGNEDREEHGNGLYMYFVSFFCNRLYTKSHIAYISLSKIVLHIIDKLYLSVHI